MSAFVLRDIPSLEEHMTRDLPLQLLGKRTPKGNVIHLYDIEGPRTHSLCGRELGGNPRRLGLGGWGEQVSADLADCARCRRLAADMPDAPVGNHRNW